MIENFIFYLHIVATSIMIGVIWVIQLVHYPSFHYIDRNRYELFQDFHMRNISWIVFPVMSVELVTGILLIQSPIFGSSNKLFFISMILLALIWFLTATLFISIHKNLSKGFNKDIINKLVNLNWLRTILWSLRIVFIFAFIFDSL